MTERSDALKFDTVEPGGRIRVTLSQREIADIERVYAGGLSSKQILEILESHGDPITEATLRKYVQLGLLPRSKRVGEKGKHRGSRGIYPVEVIRRIEEIRRAMTGGETLETLARATRAVRSKLTSVRASMSEMLDSAGTDLEAKELDRMSKSSLKNELTALDKQGRVWLKTMEKWAGSLEEAGRNKINGKVAERTTGTKSAVKRSRRPGGV